MKRCVYCNHQLVDGQKFCPYCQHQQPEQISSKGGKKGGKTLYRKPNSSRGVALVVSLILVLLLAAGVYFAWKSGLISSLISADPNQTATVTQPTAASVANAPTAVPRSTAGTMQITLATEAPVQQSAAVSAGLNTDASGRVIITSTKDLETLVEWMIETCTFSVKFQPMNLSDAEIENCVGAFPEIEKFSYSSVDLMIELHPGVHAAIAHKNGMTATLSAEETQIYQQARQIVNSIITPGMTDYEKELAIHDYIVQNCDYLIAEQQYSTDSAVGFFNYGKCQCSGYTDTFTLMCTIAGLNVKEYSGVSSNRYGSGPHAWNMIELDGQWYVVDCTWDDPVGGQPNHDYMNLPVSVLANDRTWDRSPKLRLAQGVDNNYPLIHYSRIASDASDAAAIMAGQIAGNQPVGVLINGKPGADAITDALYQAVPSLNSIAYVIDEDLFPNMTIFRLN